MKRIELLEAFYLQGKLMRELQQQMGNYTAEKKNWPSDEGLALVIKSIEADKEFDRMLKELTNWWDEALVRAETEEMK